MLQDKNECFKSDINNIINDTVLISEESEIKEETQYYEKYNITNDLIRFEENITKEELNNTDLEFTKFDINYMIKDIIKNEKNETKEEEIKYYNKIIEAIETGFTSEKYDTSYLDKGEDEELKTDKIIITFTTIKNQKNNKNNKISSIDLGECEILLRNYYNISNHETLYIKKLDIIQEGMKTIKVEYNVYSKLSGNNLIIVNLSFSLFLSIQ